jgi:hypothetical protein
MVARRRPAPYVQRRLSRCETATYGRSPGICTSRNVTEVPSRHATHVGNELITAEMLIMAGGGSGKPLDYDELERWTRTGYERGMRSRHGER